MAKKKTVAKTHTPKGSAKLRQQTAILNEAIQNNTFSRSSLSRQNDNSQDPRRSIDDDCGFPRAGNITAENYRHMFNRMPIATRVVEVLPRESWQVQPAVQETEDLDENTPFEEAWADLPRGLSGPSWHQTEDVGGNAVWEYLLRVDIQSGIGDYGVLLLGIDDGKELSEELELIKPEATATKAERKLMFLRVFDQTNAAVAKYVTEKEDSRFGQPEFYDLTFNDPSGSTQGNRPATTTERVHWSRCIHIADNLEGSEIIGTPRQQSVYNNLLSIRKVLDGSGEMYWKGAFPGLSIETHPELGGDVVFDEDATKDEIEQYQNTQKRFLLTTGLHVESLTPQGIDPTPYIRAQIEAICIRLGIPIRIFMGSERGELASGQDDETWNDRLRVRQSMYISPRVIVPFIDRLILAKVLPTPESYTVLWPDLGSPSDAAQATIAESQTKALATYVGGGVDALIPPLEFLVGVLKMDQARAEAIIESAMSQERMLVDEEEDANTEGQGNGDNSKQPTT